MRFVRYHTPSGLRDGILDGQEVVDIADLLDCDPGAVPDLIKGGERDFDRVARAFEASRRGGHAGRPVDGLRLAAPLMPEAILCSGENYWDHRQEIPAVRGTVPLFFLKLPQTVIGPGEAIEFDPDITEKLDYETELAVVIGKSGRHIPLDAAMDHVFGYTIVNDCSARDREIVLHGDGSCTHVVGPGKNFDTAAPMGPLLVTADELGDPQALTVRTLVNGELRQSNATANMIWSISELIHHISTFVTLRPGYVISTGTPGGTAWGSDLSLGGRPYGRGDVARPSRYLRPGDVVECEIERIGVLRNPVVAVGRRSRGDLPEDAVA